MTTKFTIKQEYAYDEDTEYQTTIELTKTFNTDISLCSDHGEMLYSWLKAAFIAFGYDSETVNDFFDGK